MHILLIVSALTLSAALGSPVVQLTFKIAKVVDRAQAAESGEREQDATSTLDTPPELLRGGLTIGILERIAITGLLLIGYPAGIAAIVAIKGLGRFHELKGPYGAQTSEKFVIGTLTSYIWAGFIAVIAIAIRNHI